jgi:hypothetical protein
MSDTPTPAPTPNPGDGKKRQSPGDINKKYLEEIALDRTLITEARKDSHTAQLTERGWDAARVTTFETLTNSYEKAAMLAVGRVAARKLDTQQQEAAKAAMLAAILPIRTGAKRTYRGDNDAGRDAFFVNEPTNVSLERLLFIAGELLRKLTPQPNPNGPGTLPVEFTLDGVIASDLQKLADTRADYISADQDQAKSDQDSQQAHADVATLDQQTRAQRIDLQLAADQAWPHTDKANAVTRKAFKIPADRPAIE